MQCNCNFLKSEEELWYLRRLEREWNWWPNDNKQVVRATVPRNGNTESKSNWLSMFFFFLAHHVNWKKGFKENHDGDGNENVVKQKI